MKTSVKKYKFKTQQAHEWIGMNTKRNKQNRNITKPHMETKTEEHSKHNKHIQGLSRLLAYSLLFIPYPALKNETDKT